MRKDVRDRGIVTDRVFRILSLIVYGFCVLAPILVLYYRVLH